jgi:protein NEDD1
MQAIRQLHYSKYTKSLLVAASDDGSVNMWDANAHRLLHGFHAQHGAPATSLAVSPLNAMLFISAGLDKRIVCYDAQNKVAIRTMVAESPLTSMDLMCDGATVAVGSIRGKVYIYDLRSGDVPIDIITAHKSSVQSLKYQHGSSKKVRYFFR